jgi:hypothetical protein
VRRGGEDTSGNGKLEVEDNGEGGVSGVPGDHLARRKVSSETASVRGKPRMPVT